MIVYQIYFNENQLQELDYKPYFNEECTVFFENSVIRSLIENNAHKGSDYFGVVSYQLRQKVQFTKTAWKGQPNIANHSVNEFTPAQFERELLKNRPDAMSFQRHIAHDPIILADKYHPHFSKYFRYIMKEIGYNWSPTFFQNVFYCNYFVAKSHIYEKYVREMLIPAMDVMQQMPELMGDSRYPKQLPENLKKSFGVSHYPYHAFLCERMFSYFAHLNKLKCLHY